MAETIADIIAEKRRQADKIERDCAEKMKRGEMVSDCYARELVADIRREADRIWAAHDHDIATAIEASARAVVGACVKQQEAERDCAKLREALKLYDRIIQDRTLIYDCDIVYGARTLARAALAAPPRNCDVGTSDEQALRFAEFCCKHHTAQGRWICHECHCKGNMSEITHCLTKWAQMPYEEGGRE